MRYFEKQKEEYLKTWKSFPSSLPNWSLDDNGKLAIEWAKKECGVDFSEYVHALIREDGIENMDKIGKTLQDLMFQTYRVKAGI